MPAAGVVVSQDFIQAQIKVLRAIFSRTIKELTPEFSGFFNDYSEYAEMKRSFWQVLPIIGFGMLGLKTEGGVPMVDAPKEGTPWGTSYLTYELMYSITREMKLEDPANIQGGLPRLLAYAALQTYEQLTWNILNYGFTSGVAYWDGQPLFSATHPLDGGTTSGTVYSNLLLNAALSPEALQEARVLFRTWPDDRGLKIKLTPMDLLYPPTLSKNATEVLKSEYYPWSDENRINTNYNAVKPRESTYFTSDINWCVAGGRGGLEQDAHRLGYHFKWRDVQETGYDFKTSSTMHKISSRLTWTAFDGRGIVGSQGAG